MKDYTAARYNRITTATDTEDIGDGDCILDGLVLAASPTGNITIYNGTTVAGGTAVLIIPSGAPAGPWPLGIYLRDGLSINTAAGDEVLVVYRDA